MTRNIHNIKLRGYSVTSPSLTLGTDGSYGKERISIEDKDSAWDGLIIKATFTNAAGASVSVVVYGSEVDVPHEATEAAGVGQIAFVGYDDKNTERIRTTAFPYRVSLAGITEGGNPGAITPTLAEQMLAAEVRREANERIRTANEEERKINETLRVNAEEERNAAEAARKTATAEAIAKAEDSSASASHWSAEAKAAAEAANEAADTANERADLALIAATRADTAAYAANESADTANERADLALIAATRADTAAYAANAAANRANTEAATAHAKAQAAVSAAAAANNAASRAEAALQDQEQLNQTLADAKTARTAAETAQGKAENAQEKSETARGAAETAQEKSETARTAAENAANNSSSYAAVASAAATHAQAEANRAEAARAKAEEVVESCIPDDTAVDGKPWTSKKILDSLCVPFEESGNPVQVYPVEGYPIGVKVRWEPVQEGSGTPSPDNIRPITGRDSVTVERCGENLLNISQLKPEGYNLAGSNTLKPNTTYTFKPVSCGGINFSVFLADNIDPNQTTKQLNLTRNYIKEGESATFTTPSNSGSYSVMWLAGSKRGIDQVYPNVQFILVSGTTAPTTYTPYIGQTNTLTLPETVYGGTLDVETGVITVDWGKITINPEKIRKVNEDSYCYTILNDHSAKPAKGGADNAISNVMISIDNVGNDVTGNSFALYGNGIIRFYIDGITTLEDMVAFATDNPIVIAYRFATPYTIQLTQQQIAALSGVNTIYTDADGVVVTGAEDPKHTITELKNAIISLGGNV